MERASARAGHETAPMTGPAAALPTGGLGFFQAGFTGFTLTSEVAGAVEADEVSAAVAGCKASD